MPSSPLTIHWTDFAKDPSINDKDLPKDAPKWEVPEQFKNLITWIFEKLNNVQKKVTISVTNKDSVNATGRFLLRWRNYETDMDIINDLKDHRNFTFEIGEKIMKFDIAYLIRELLFKYNCNMDHGMFPGLMEVIGCDENGNDLGIFKETTSIAFNIREYINPKPDQNSLAALSINAENFKKRIGDSIFSTGVMIWTFDLTFGEIPVGVNHVKFTISMNGLRKALESKGVKNISDFENFEDFFDYYDGVQTVVDSEYWFPDKYTLLHGVTNLKVGLEEDKEEKPKEKHPKGKRYVKKDGQMIEQDSDSDDNGFGDSDSDGFGSDSDDGFGDDFDDFDDDFGGKKKKKKWGKEKKGSKIPLITLEVTADFTSLVEMIPQNFPSVRLRPNFSKLVSALPKKLKQVTVTSDGKEYKIEDKSKVQTDAKPYGATNKKVELAPLVKDPIVESRSNYYKKWDNLRDSDSDDEDKKKSKKPVAPPKTVVAPPKTVVVPKVETAKVETAKVETAKVETPKTASSKIVSFKDNILKNDKSGKIAELIDNGSITFDGPKITEIVDDAPKAQLSGKNARWKKQNAIMSGRWNTRIFPDNWAYSGEYIGTPENTALKIFANNDMIDTDIYIQEVTYGKEKTIHHYKCYHQNVTGVLSVTVTEVPIDHSKLVDWYKRSFDNEQ